jgi:hypothetical protein
VYCCYSHPLQDQVASYGLLEEAERGSHDLDRPRPGITEAHRSITKVKGPEGKPLTGSGAAKASASAAAGNASTAAKRRGSGAKK